MVKVTMGRELLVALVILGVVWGEVNSCNSCGSECQPACGTRNFRTCCFNYMKKRSGESALPLPMDPSLRLELWLAKSRLPAYFQHYNDAVFDSSLEESNDKTRQQA